MSQEARDMLVKNERIYFQNESQRTDLETIETTRTELVALLLDLVVNARFSVEITAVKSDHHDDSALGEHTHANGYAADLWPIRPGGGASDYMDATDPGFAHFLSYVARHPLTYQIGLAGSAWTVTNSQAAGSTVFHDDGADHVHIGVRSL